MITTRRLFDGVVIALGLWLIVTAPLLLNMDRGLAMGSLMVLGLIIIGFSVWGETGPKNAAPEIVNVFLGFLLSLSPWLLSFTDVVYASWNTWIVGIAMIVLEAIAIPGAMLERTPQQPGTTRPFLHRE